LKQNLLVTYTSATSVTHVAFIVTNYICISKDSYESTSNMTSLQASGIMQYGLTFKFMV